MRITNFYQADSPAQESDFEFPGEPVGTFYEPVADPETGVISLVENTQKKTAQVWTSLRAQRNQLLIASDWTQGNDSPLSTESKSAWATYRAALRNLPDVTSDPSNPTWPSAPQ